MAARTKRVLLFLVEGPTDEAALGPALKRLFQSERVHFHVAHGDLTTDPAMTSANAVKAVYSRVQWEMKRYGFEKRDLLRIVHLIDTDGAFIPDESVVAATVPHVRYEVDHIETAAPDKIRQRNARKSAVLSRLSAAASIAQIPYGVFYFSRNLEHVLHGEGGELNDNEKITLADVFSDRYAPYPDKFVAFFSSPDFAVQGSYRDTWSFIMQDLHSLHRHCNFHLLFTPEEK